MGLRPFMVPVPYQEVHLSYLRREKLPKGHALAAVDVSQQARPSAPSRYLGPLRAWQDSGRRSWGRKQSVTLHRWSRFVPNEIGLYPPNLGPAVLSDLAPVRWPTNPFSGGRMCQLTESAYEFDYEVSTMGGTWR
jgi:hypothetical protein